MRVKITLRFDGAAYCGWQVQKNALSVQEAVQNALEKRYNQRFELTGCSRTDSGVHANRFVAHIDGIDEKYVNTIVPALNITLPEDICVLDAQAVSEDFHARYSAVGKEYLYIVHNSSVKNPFYRGRAYRTAIHSTVEQLNLCCKAFEGKHDFSSFMAAGSKITDPVRTVAYFRAETDIKDSELINFYVKADGFLYNMVRIMVGTVIGIANGSIKQSAAEIIASKNRENAGVTAPPEGLYLNRVFY